LTGAKPKPQLPITIEVTPCQLEIVQSGISFLTFELQLFP